ncbi:CheR family methyltransferase [Sandaracinus amylolyticus]|uniref:protein-glutamate O-methyltransferase n=1 Tax=Sandaracinus amylolyticus TaxID=927083 RepID=A0A0F6W4W8_9BACT|nr:protein-glutamate O-methyltransferase CheR [Sandaracinus amylolyticus]AKF07358.1 Chemotaxis protein methyltransferase CheR [Sandaracinus amylolyticus]
MTDRAPQQILTVLARLVEERTGLHYSERDRDLFEQKLADHAAEEGYPTLLELYYALRYDDPDGEVLDRVIDALVVGETYFFREARGLEVLLEPLIERARRGEQVRIWSAACATGEEPITMAILLDRAGVLDRVELVATDISPRALERARRGEHTRRAHRAVPDGMPPWIQVDGDRAIVDERLRARIDWRRVNLVDEAAVAALGRFDAIVCRNVLIYFHDEQIQRVASSLARALQPGGELLIGASESLLRFGSMFQCVERGGVFLYGVTS